MDFRSRATTPELMDSEACDFAEFQACLVDLARVNRLTLAYRPTLAFMRRLARTHWPVGRPLQILDVGSGYGDMLRLIARWADRRGLSLSLTGVDLNPHARQAAMAGGEAGINWVTADIFDYQPESGIDIVLSALFTHHLTDPDLIRFLRWMEANARLGWFVNDLERHPLPYHVFKQGARLAGWHRFVRHDGPVSISRAFTPRDWRGYTAAAGLAADDVTITRWLPYRLAVSRLKP